LKVVYRVRKSFHRTTICDISVEKWQRNEKLAVQKAETLVKTERPAKALL
jgi:hypothetical protein